MSCAVCGVIGFKQLKYSLMVSSFGFRPCKIHIRDEGGVISQTLLPFCFCFGFIGCMSLLLRNQRLLFGLFLILFGPLFLPIGFLFFLVSYGFLT